VAVAGSIGTHAHLRLAVLVSGQGTNLQALIDASEAGTMPATVALVVSNAAEAGALARAARHGIPAFVATRAEYPRRAERHQAIQERVEAAGADLLVLAGFNEILVDTFCQRFRGRMINTHPSLLPAFGGGMHAVREALAYGVKVSGCTVHYVTEDVDAGPILVQRCVPVLDDDTEETLHARIREQEHVALPEAVTAIARGQVGVVGRRVLGAAPPG
jgi:phosphoribosylglycinamide formyltransferase-1